MALDRESALRTVKKVLKTDYACEEWCFDEEGVFVYQARENEGRRQFPFREKSLTVVTMGRGVVVSCSPERLRWAKANLGHLARDEIFRAFAIARMEKYVSRDNQSIVGPGLKYICTQDSFQPYASPGRINVSTVEGEQMQELYQTSEFSNALGYRHDPRRPRTVAFVAKYEGRIVGIAAASADCDEMWQVGVDTLSNYRGHGIGKALVSMITRTLFGKGKLPYYSTQLSNIISRRLATSLGYWPAWVDLYAIEKGLR
ncbi:GNAT family N-acetyltransferase [Chloroflexota bacterium]